MSYNYNLEGREYEPVKNEVMVH